MYERAEESRGGEEERRLTWYMKMSPERRDLVPVETINSSLQWLPEGPRASRASSEEEGPSQENEEQFHFTFISLFMN